MQAFTVECLPAGMLTELLRLSSGPSPSNTNPGPALELQTASNEFASDALSLCTAPLGNSASEQLQDSLAAQLDPVRPHTPEQLASAGHLFASMLQRCPTSLLPRCCALLATALRRAAEDSESQHAAEISTVADSCMHALCKRMGCAAPSVQLSHRATTLDGAGDCSQPSVLAATLRGSGEPNGQISTAKLDKCVLPSWPCYALFVHTAGVIQSSALVETLPRAQWLRG
jgi:hypothetical protein